MSDDFTTEDFIRQLEQSPDPDERLYAAFKLGRDKSLIVIPPLLAASDDAEFTVRTRVAEALGTRDHAPEVLPTLYRLLRDDVAVVRRTAADSLGNIGDPQAVPALCQALTDADATVRSHTAEALGAIASDEAAAALVTVFLHDDDYNVRYFAKQSLGKVGKAAVSAILDVVQVTEDSALLIEICEILGNLSDGRAKPALQALTQHPDVQVAEMAAWALKRIWD